MTRFRYLFRPALRLKNGTLTQKKFVATFRRLHAMIDQATEIDLFRRSESQNSTHRLSRRNNHLSRSPKVSSWSFLSDPGFKLQLQSLEVRQSGIELCNSRIDDEVMHAAVFVPEGKVAVFVRRLEAYVAQQPGKRDYRTLAEEAITAVRLAALESFWTDAGSFPQENDIKMTWEVWFSPEQPEAIAIVSAGFQQRLIPRALK